MSQLDEEIAQFLWNEYIRQGKHLMHWSFHPYVLWLFRQIKDAMDGIYD